MADFSGLKSRAQDIVIPLDSTKFRQGSLFMGISLNSNKTHLILLWELPNIKQSKVKYFSV